MPMLEGGPPVEVSTGFMQLFEMICKGGPTGVLLFAVVVWILQVMPTYIAPRRALKESAEKVSEGYDDVGSSLKTMAEGSLSTNDMLRDTHGGVNEIRIGVSEHLGRK